MGRGSMRRPERYLLFFFVILHQSNVVNYAARCLYRFPLCRCGRAARALPSVGVTTVTSVFITAVVTAHHPYFCIIVRCTRLVRLPHKFLLIDICLTYLHQITLSVAA